MLFCTFGQRLWYIVPIQDFLQEWDSDGFLEIVQGSGGILGYPGVGKKDFELGDVIFDRRVSLSHLNYFVKGISLFIVQFEGVSEVLKKVAPFPEIGLSLGGYRSFEKRGSP